MGRGIWTYDTTLSGIELTDFEKDLYQQHVECETYNFYNHKTTVLVIKLKSGFEITGTSGCEDPKKFNEELGRQFALKRALGQLAEHLAFYRAQASYYNELTELRQVRDVAPEVIEELRSVVKSSMVETIREVNNTLNTLNNPFYR